MPKMKVGASDCARRESVLRHILFPDRKSVIADAEHGISGHEK